VEIDEWIDLGGKVKFPRGVVVHTGDQISATRYIMDNGATGAVIGGTATAGDGGTATAGDGGTATAGRYGTATAGRYGTATAGRYGTATAGEYGTIQIKHWDGSRMRIKTAYVREDGIEANVPYRLNDEGEFVKS
jgi:hypothetical protein